MKAVILAGGLGTRMREHTEFRPKPMVDIGGRPVLWHIMKNLAVHGIREFVIATGYMGTQISDYFLHFSTRHADFSITLGDASSLQLHGTVDERDWNVTVAHTGIDTPTGGRILAVADFLRDEDFLVTYGDGLANIDISALVECHRNAGLEATVSVVQPLSRFGVVELGAGGEVTAFNEKPHLSSLVSIGFFIFSPSLLNRLRTDSVLEQEPLTDLVNRRQLNSYRHAGFWQPMDTFREHQQLQSLWEGGDPPWKTW